LLGTSSGIIKFMNKKKYPTGFVPVNFNAVGKVLLVVGTIVFFLGLGNELFNLFNLPNNLLVVGLVFGLAGLYLVFVVPKE
jgi:hypothetical protein